MKSRQTNATERNSEFSAHGRSVCHERSFQEKSGNQDAHPYIVPCKHIHAFEIYFDFFNVEGFFLKIKRTIFMEQNQYEEGR